MNGSAPNSPATGSQVSVRQKLKPNFWIDSIDCRVSSKPIATTISTRTSANAPVPSLKPRSFDRRHRVSTIALMPACNDETLIFASAAISSFTTAAGSGA